MYEEKYLWTERILRTDIYGTILDSMIKSYVAIRLIAMLKEKFKN